ncbi:hypothetical protein CUR95_14020 [Bordetella bronchiseptica]|nr:hypothetical protein [Bordetella bronchiseptica]
MMEAPSWIVTVVLEEKVMAFGPEPVPSRSVVWSKVEPVWSSIVEFSPVISSARKSLGELCTCALGRRMTV